MCEKHHLKTCISRRALLRYSLLGAGIYSLSPLVRNVYSMPMEENRLLQNAGNGNGKFMILIECNGGNDTLNMAIPIGSSHGTYKGRRSSLGIDVANVLSLNSGPAATSTVGLHPNLSNMATLYGEGSLAIIHKVGFPGSNGSHFTCTDIFATGDESIENANNSAGWIARYAKLHAPHLTGCVVIGYDTKSVKGEPTANPISIDDLNNFRYDADGSNIGFSAKRLEVTRQILGQYASANAMNVESQKALAQGHENVDKIQAAISNFNPTASFNTNTSLERSARDIAALIQHDINTSELNTHIYYTGFGGFDTHGSQGALNGDHPNLIATLDRVIGALSTELKALGKWNDCVIVAFSEFGRRNDENGSNGTDHGTGQHIFVAGGAVNGGLLGSEMSAADINQDNMPMESDFRQIYKEIIRKHLGVADPTQIFPSTNLLANSELGIL